MKCAHTLQILIKSRIYGKFIANLSIHHKVLRLFSVDIFEQACFKQILCMRLPHDRIQSVATDGRWQLFQATTLVINKTFTVKSENKRSQQLSTELSSNVLFTGTALSEIPGSNASVHFHTQAFF